MSNNKKKNKYFIKFIIVSIIFLVIVIISLFIGRYKLNFNDIVLILIGKSNDISTNLVINIRIPRIILAILIGSCLSISGCAYQVIFSNPIVSPDILGASSGAGFGASLGILLSFSYFGISLFAFVFGIIAVLLAYFISKISKINITLSMVLTGIMISSLFSAAISLIKLIADKNSQLPAITYWLMGSLSSAKPSDILFLLPIFVICSIPLFLLSWRINLLSFGDSEAKSMGVNVKLIKIIVIISATLMTSACVSISGMIGWVGLLIPHFCRKIFGYDLRKLFPAVMLLGASFLLLADDIARTITTTEIPIGILTAFVGVPIFISMLISKGEKFDY